MKILLVGGDKLVAQLNRFLGWFIQVPAEIILAEIHNAWAAAQKENPDMVILDLEDAGEALKVVRNVKKLDEDIQVLILAGARNKNLDKVIKEGADGLLVKPYAEAELAAMIKTAVKSRRQANEFHAKRRILEEVELSRIFLDATPDWEYLLDTQGNYTYVSPAFEQLTGYQPAEFIRDPGFLVTLTHPDDQDLLLKHIESLMQSSEPLSMEFRIMHRNGEVRWISHLCQPLYDKEGILLGRRASNRDITKQKRDITDKKLIQEELQQSYSELERRVTERTAELAKTNEDLQTEIKRRIHTEMVLRESEELLRESQLAAGIGSYIVDLLTNTWKGSAVLCGLLGIQEKEGHLFDRWAAVIHPDWLETISQQHDRTVKEGAHFNQEYKIIRQSDGVERWVNDIGKLEYDVTGTPIKLVGTMMDITERKRIEETLVKNEAFIRSVLDNLPIGIAANSVNPVVKFDYMNENFAKFYRTTKEALADPDTFWEAVYEDEVFREHIKKRVLEDCASGDPKRMYWVDIPITREGQGTFYITAMNIPLPDQMLMISTVWDVTDRKVAEQLLLESERRYALVVDNLPNGRVHIVDKDYRYVFSAGQGHQKMGMPVKDFQGKTPHDLFSAKAAHKIISNYRSAFGGEDVTYTVEHNMRAFLSNAIPLINENGLAEQLIVLSIDITEQKLAEKKLKKLNQELGQRVKMRTAQLEASNKELEAFNYSVSHDLRAPLRAVMGFSNMVMEEYADKLDSEGIRLLNVVCENTQRMDQLITNLLELSRVSRTKMKPALINMEALVQSVYKEMLPPKECSFEFSFAPLPDSVGDEPLIRQVWLNLLSNALKYSMPKEMRKIEVGSYVDSGMNVYFVKDSGVGFNSSYTDKLFGIFQRLHSSKEFEGTGIGLAIVQRIIHRQGGQVWAKGEVDEGATFYFSLPIMNLDSKNDKA